MWSIHPAGTSDGRRVHAHHVVQPWGRNPVLRSSDRLQATLRILAAIVIVAAVPVCCAIGTALYTRELAQVQARNATETAVTATLSADPVATVTSGATAGSVVTTDKAWHAPVVWTFRGQQGAATVPVPSSARHGSRIQLWLGSDSRPSTGPLPTSVAAFRSIGSAVTLLAGVVSAVVFSLWSTGRLLDWRRGAWWEAEWRLIDHNGTVTP